MSLDFKHSEINILGIETSCDETSVAIYSNKQGLLTHAIYTQTDIHQVFGGVVPELASRDHIQKLLPMINQALQKAAFTYKDLHGVAYTTGPGLIGALMVGAATGRSLAYSLGIPAIGVHHIEAHLLITLLENPDLTFPFLALLVSGGHTQLIHIKDINDYELLGESIDDAAGEAFDKTAKLLKLPYPGGPALAKLAEKGRPGKFTFPRPMLNRPGLDFSFSGLKTSVLNTLNKLPTPINEQTKADIAYSFQEAVVETLIAKCERALMQTQLNTLVVAGGVGANQLLRQRVFEKIQAMGKTVFYPRPEFCTDNGAMIAYTGYLKLAQGKQSSLSIECLPRWPLSGH